MITTRLGISRPTRLYVTTEDAYTLRLMIDVVKITGHQYTRRRGVVIAILYDPQWNGILGPIGNRKRELDLLTFRHPILAY